MTSRSNQIKASVVSFLTGLLVFWLASFLPASYWHLLEIPINIAPKITDCQDALPGQSCMFVAWVSILIMGTAAYIAYFVFVSVALKILEKKLLQMKLTAIGLGIGWFSIHFVSGMLGDYGDNVLFLAIDAGYVAILFIISFYLVGLYDRLRARYSST
jgi:hypothetical protein